MVSDLYVKEKVENSRSENRALNVKYIKVESLMSFLKEIRGGPFTENIDIQKML